MSCHFLNLCLVVSFFQLIVAFDKFIDKRAAKNDRKNDPESEFQDFVSMKYKLVFFGCAFVVASGIGTLLVVSKYLDFAKIFIKTLSKN
jgi:hypothetical protein